MIGGALYGDGESWKGDGLGGYRGVKFCVGHGTSEGDIYEEMSPAESDIEVKVRERSGLDIQICKNTWPWD